MNRIPEAWALAACLACVLLFVGFPQIDLWASGLLYADGAGFTLKGHPAIVLMRNAVNDLAPIVMLGLLYFLFLSGLQRALAPQRKAVIYMLLLLIVGPGLVVNGLFKEHWGRARPRDVAEFGGDRAFSPAVLIAKQCDHNCSFTCGDASVGFYLVGLAFLLPARRRTWLTIAIVVGGVVGLGRMSQGAHYLSDVVFSYFAVYFSAALLHYLMYREPTRPPARR